MRYSIFIVVMILTVGPGAAQAEKGRQVAPGVSEVRLDLPDHLTKKLPTGSGGLLSYEKAGSIAVKPVSATPSEEWVTLLADDFESGFPGTTWTIFYEETGPYWDDWSCSPGSTPPNSVGCAAGGDGAINCGEDYPNFLNTFMTAGPFSLADSYSTAGFLECILNLNSEIEIDVFFMLVSLTGVDDWNGFQYSGGFTDKHISMDLAEVPFLGNILNEPEVWVSFGFRSNGSIVDVNGAQIDDVILAVTVSEPPGDVPSLQISALKNPGRPRTFQILVLVTNGSGSAPAVTVGGSNVAMTSLGQSVYSGNYSAAQAAMSATISASDTNIEGSGSAQATISFQGMGP
jgi:hypothetical protein